MAVPEPVKLLGAIVAQVSPVGTVSDRLTVPENSFDGLRVMVDVEEAPTPVAGGEEAVMAKSWT